MKTITESQFAEVFLSDRPLIDVRAPIEYGAGKIPNSVCLPILNDHERELVGTAYKQIGKDAAIQLGHKLVDGQTKQQRLQSWLDFIKQNPTAVLFCFRGGLRSKTAQQWINEAGVQIPRVDGGYKVLRQYLIQQIDDFSKAKNLLVLSGPTGSGKSLIIKKAMQFYPTIDLEGTAHHRGSAFGHYLGEEQPTQITFENQLGKKMLQLKSLAAPILVEDESRLIGRCVQPESLFNKLRSSDVVLINESLMSRVEITFSEYVENSSENKEEVFASFKQACLKISKKLGGAKTKEIFDLINKSQQDYNSGFGLESNKLWIKELLLHYYDPLYLQSLNRRKPKILFVGSREDVFEYLHEQNKKFDFNSSAPVALV